MDWKDFRYFLLSILHYSYISRLNNNLTKWSNYFKQFVGKLQIADELFDCVWPFCAVGAEKG